MLHLRGTPPMPLVQKFIMGALLTCIMMVFYCFSAKQAQMNVQMVSHGTPCIQSEKQNDFNISQRTKGQERSCVAKVNLMFMKTHKTASSTLLNILLRFGQKHRLKIALPNGRNDFMYPSPFLCSHVKDYRPGKCFNLICNHMRFNGPEVDKLLPGDAVYFTILKNPADLFESSFHYYHRLVPFTWQIPGDNKLAEFLRDPRLYFTPAGYNSFYLRNLLFFDFGYDNNMEPEDPKVIKAIQNMDKRFQLVLMAEYFEESLILLKDILCWEMEDLLFFKLNVRKDSSVSQLSRELKIKALEWNGADWMLYQYFNATFWRKVEAYGHKRMQKDVRELRRRNAEMETVCIEGREAVEPKRIRDTNMMPWQPLGERSIMGYNMRNDIPPQYKESCRNMLTPEIQYLSDLGVNLWVTRLWGWFKDRFVWLF